MDIIFPIMIGLCILGAICIAIAWTTIFVCVLLDTVFNAKAPSLSLGLVAYVPAILLILFSAYLIGEKVL